jgi:hypothetical protein
MNLDQAQKLTQGQWIYSTTNRTANDTPARVKVLSIKTWKRKPDRILISCKHGIKVFFKLNERELDTWESDEETADKIYNVNLLCNFSCEAGKQKKGYGI